MSAKPFEPTQSRLARARREGDHPLAHDAVAACGFAAGSTALVAAMPSLAASASGMIAAGAGLRFDAGALARLAEGALAVTAASAGGAVCATLLQTGGPAFRFPAMRLGFRFPFTAAAAPAAVRAATATLAATWAIAALVYGRLTAAAAPPALGESAAGTYGELVRLLATVAAVGAVAACVEFWTVRAAWLKRLRMSHDELRRDLRENDGDPQTRSRRRGMHRSILKGSLREVRRASFVVVNPEHVAVALRYHPVETPVPEILVRAYDEGAARVKALAREAGIPIVENVSLARSLFAHGALGPIPRDLYVATAQIVATLARRLSG